MAFSLGFKKKWNSHLLKQEKKLMEKLKHTNDKEETYKLKKKYHRKIVLHKNIEQSRAQFVIPLLFLEYSQVCLQFGLMAIFTATCPAGAFCCYIINWVDLRWTKKTYSKYIKRLYHAPVGSMGGWTEIFTIVAFASAILNPLL